MRKRCSISKVKKDNCWSEQSPEKSTVSTVPFLLGHPVYTSRMFRILQVTDQYFLSDRLTSNQPCIFKVEYHLIENNPAHRHTLWNSNVYVGLLCDGTPLWKWLCSHGPESRSERHFGSQSETWLGSWFELRAFTCIANWTPSQSWSGPAHCKVIFCSYCVVHADWPMHGFSMASARISKTPHAQITFRKSFAFHIS